MKMIRKTVLSLLLILIIFITYSIYIGTVDVRSHFFPRLRSGNPEALLSDWNEGARNPSLSPATESDKPVAIQWYLLLVCWESRLLWLLSSSSIIVSIFNYMLSFVTQMFTGHLSALELAGASIASVGIQGLAYGIMV